MQKINNPDNLVDSTNNSNNSVNEPLYNSLNTIDEIISDLLPSSKLSDFSDIINKIEERINLLYKDYISKYSDTFQNFFKRGVISGFDKNDKEYDILINLLYNKNYLTNSCIFYYINNGGLDSLLTPEEKNDIIRIYLSGIISYFDKLAMNWIKTNKDGSKDLKLPIYGALINGYPTPYSKLIDEKVSDFPILHSEALYRYITSILNLMETTTSYKIWVDLQGRYEKIIWDNGNIGIVGPQENYILGDKIKEPSLSLFLKRPSKANEKGTYLSNKYFGKSYGLEKLKAYLVEILFESGTASTKKIAGENIPVDTKLLSEYKISLYINSRFKVPLNEKISASLLETIKVDEQLYSDIIKDFVIFHELGHNIFIDFNKKNKPKLEEFKADLFHFLFLKDNGTENISITILWIMQFAMIYLKFLDTKTYEIKNLEKEKYIYSNAIIITQLLNTKVIEIVGNKIKINEQNFNNFLELMFKIYNDDIKKLYTDWENLSTEKEENIEQKILDKYIDFEKVSLFVDLLK